MTKCHAENNFYDKLSKIGKGSGPDVTGKVLSLIVNLEQGITQFAVKCMIKVAVTA